MTKNLAILLSSLFTVAALWGCERADDSAAQAQAVEGAAEVAEVPAAPAAAEAPAAEEAAPSGGPAPTRTNDDGSRLFGDELSEREPIALTSLIEAPGDYDGQVVLTEGVITQVCQRMGCWMELKPSEDGPAIRVPMAGHSFFLPRDVSGARATIEGTVEVEELPEDWQEHLREEGAQAADQNLAISATGVLIHAG